MKLKGHNTKNVKLNKIIKKPQIQPLVLVKPKIV